MRRLEHLGLAQAHIDCGHDHRMQGVGQPLVADLRLQGLAQRFARAGFQGFEHDRRVETEEAAPGALPASFVLLD